eukprot:CAMPEP_0171870608 /NCGR_PEP_ID=MMETSP0992-20121227/32722_1 /TAXON_ID=483369 /ORGANISM="non described non described, Strain CCMP2098" /LENGTH=163 /DNA_ID=CAMNT_0012494739 /DNA_START=50 /DNA_END=536 /DNA_ORIENTATION=-
MQPSSPSAAEEHCRVGWVELQARHPGRTSSATRLPRKLVEHTPATVAGSTVVRAASLKGERGVGGLAGDSMRAGSRHAQVPDHDPPVARAAHDFVLVPRRHRHARVRARRRSQRAVADVEHGARVSAARRHVPQLQVLRAHGEQASVAVAPPTQPARVERVHA